MYILFSPSESKNIPTHRHDTKQSELKYLFSQKAYKTRALHSYLEALKTSNEAKLHALFGSKVIDLDSLSLSQNLLSARKIKAIELYSGVGYKALDFASLPKREREFLESSLLIFSNLFGTVLASDELPYYNLHQGKGFGDFALKTIYTRQERDLHEFLLGSEILDLRAEAYVKVSPVHVPHTQIEFLKNGKKISHFSKHYRGIFARQIALHRCMLSEIESLEFENLRLLESKNLGHKRLLSYEICS
ncbi:MAG: YaaA family protein [Helicobacter sp.]|nr:YaaA family protein [Helicobacter sp.]